VEPPPEPLPLPWCLERAARANPELAAEAAAAEAARHRIVPAGALEDPRFRYEASNVPTGDLDFASTPLSGHQLALSQKLPVPGLLGAREDAARAASAAAHASLEDRRLRVAAAVERAWTELGFAQRALAITLRNVELLRQLARIAETKYQVGEGLQQDVLRAQVQLTRLLDERLERESSVAHAEASLAAHLDLPPAVPLGRTGPLEESAPVPALAPLLERVEAGSPRLVALTAQVEEAERLRRAARLEGYPDLDLGVGYRIRKRVAGDAVDGDDFLMAGLTVRLPVDRGKWRARVAERDALARRARAAWRAERARLRDAVRSAHASLQRADSEVVLLETGLVPQSRQSLESSRSGYEVDEVDFLALVDSQVSLLRAELRLVRARADRRTAFAALEAAVGGSLR
jgi:outer membrane protein TolC